MRGRPKKVSVMQETPHRSNPERRATTSMNFVAEPISIAAELNTTTVQQDDGLSNYTSSQIHTRSCGTLKVMGCDEHECI